MMLFRLNFPVDLSHDTSWFGSIGNARQFLDAVSPLFFDDPVGLGVLTCTDAAWPAYKAAMDAIWPEGQSVEAISTGEAFQLFEAAMMRRLA